MKGAITRKQKTSPKVNEKLQALKKLKVVSAVDAEALGVSRRTLNRWVNKEYFRPSKQRGVFVAADENEDYDPRVEEFAAACKDLGDKSVVGGMTALFHYNLTENVPNHIWMLVPKEVRSTNRVYRLLRVKEESLRAGVDDHGTYRIVSVERAILDAFHYATKIGDRTAVEAARRALKDKLTTQKKLLETATTMGIKNILHKNWNTFI